MENSYLLIRLIGNLREKKKFISATIKVSKISRRSLVKVAVSACPINFLSQFVRLLINCSVIFITMSEREKERFQTRYDDDCDDDRLKVRY